MLLEEKVAERTESLNNSTQELQMAMSRLEKMAQVAEQSNKAKTHFLANISHEVRTPLNGIIGCTELILKSDSLDSAHDLASVSLNEAEHLLNLINNVLDYSKIEAGKIELENRTFDLVRLVESVIDGLIPQAMAKGIGLKHRWDEQLYPIVRGDALRLRQILINLINNAIKFTPSGSVTLDVKAEGTDHDRKKQGVRFSITDTGIGIPYDRQEAIFKRFTQVDESTTRRFGGTGLGTTIAYQLVALMGGELALNSEENQGSEFFFTLWFALGYRPEGEDDARLSAARPETPKQKNQLPARILIAEDTPVNQLVLRSHLKELNHHVVIVDNGLKAVEACEKENFDLVLMDIQMPEMDGITATKKNIGQPEWARCTGDTGFDRRYSDQNPK